MLASAYFACSLGSSLLDSTQGIGERSHVDTQETDSGLVGRIGLGPASSPIQSLEVRIIALSKLNHAVTAFNDGLPVMSSPGANREARYCVKFLQ